MEYELRILQRAIIIPEMCITFFVPIFQCLHGPDGLDGPAIPAKIQCNSIIGKRSKNV